MSWTEEKIKQLKKLWSKGKTTVEIAKEMGISKNSVIGKVHRLDLTARPSPIKRKETVVSNHRKPASLHKNSGGKCRLMDLKTNTCRWPIGEPEDKDFHFCGKQTSTGKPYCPDHCLEAYTSLKELMEQPANQKQENSPQKRKG